jgi:hypothetical protein
MSRFSGPALGLMLAAAATGRTAGAGEIANCFSQGMQGSCTQRVLENVQFKAVVLQFVDPAKTDLGESFSRLLWREILDSISNLSNAGVILAYDRQGEIQRALGGKEYRAFLETEYHAAAEAISTQLKTQMSIWGAVIADGDGLLVQPFLTMDSQQGPWTTLTMHSGVVRELSLGARIAGSRLNLEPLVASRQHLFDRPFVTRCALSAGCPQGVPLRADASNDSAIIGYAPVGSAVQATDMQREWIKLRWRDDKTAYVNIYHVEMFPLRITFNNRTDVVLRAGPKTASAQVAKVRLDGDYDVIGAARGANAEPWYRIRVGNDTGWIAGRLVARRSYIFPAVNLIGGLFRYGRGDYKAAAQAFQAFLAEAPTESNVTRAAVYQFLAASRIAGGSGVEPGIEAAVADLDESAKLTPFDPAVYNLRAVVRLGSGHGLMAGLKDIEQSLSLDPADPDARRLLKSLVEISNRHLLDVLAPGQDINPPDQLLEQLRQRYLKT